MHAEAMLEEMGVKPRAKKSGPPTAARVASFVAQADEMVKSGEWNDARPVHFVGLYKLLHQWCYGVESQLSGMTFMAASSAAARMLRSSFGDDRSAFLDYLRWTWGRERETEKWRRDNGKPGGVMSWQRVFLQTGMVDRYRVEQERRKESRR